MEILYPLSERVFRHHPSLTILHYTHESEAGAIADDVDEFVPTDANDHHRKRHRRVHNEIRKEVQVPVESMQRFKRHQTNNHVNYCCKNPDGKVCRKLMCGHYEP